MRLKNYSQPPYGGVYRVNDPDKGMVGEGYNYESLVNSVKAWRRANGVPIGLDFEPELEQFLCKMYPTECREETKKPRPDNRLWSMHDIVRGSKVMFLHAVKGFPLVTQEEASRRSQICSTCPNRVKFHKPCTGLCPELVALIAAVGHRSTPYDNNQVACGICKCYVKVSVWLPLETQCIGVTPEMQEKFKDANWCWKQCATTQ